MPENGRFKSGFSEKFKEIAKFRRKVGKFQRRKTICPKTGDCPKMGGNFLGVIGGIKPG